jgi:rubredoxin
MKILQHGKKQNNLVKICTIKCACGCVFEFTADDPQIHWKKDTRNHIDYYIKCPDCNTSFPLKLSFILGF